MILSKRIPKSDYLSGLTLCEENALRCLKNSMEKIEQEYFQSAYIYCLISFEEFVKAYMILECWDDEDISGNKWKKM